MPANVSRRFNWAIMDIVPTPRKDFLHIHRFLRKQDQVRPASRDFFREARLA